MQRIDSSDNLADVMERIVGRGIEVDPWASVCLAEPDRLHLYRWVVDCRVVNTENELRKVA